MRSMFRMIFTTLLLTFPLFAAAQEVTDCSDIDPMRVMHAPDLTFGEDGIRLWDLRDADGARLVVFATGPTKGQRMCRYVGLDRDAGFLEINLDQVASHYDPQAGLSLEFPVVLDDTGEPLMDQAMLSITVNRASGMIAVELWGG